MDAVLIVPEAELLPLPAPAGLLHFLLLLTFFLHLVAMNGLLGWILLAAWNRLRARSDSDQHALLARRLSGVAPNLVATTVSLGVAPLLFVQTLFGQFFFTSSILMGWGWFSVIVVLILAYYGTYWLAVRAGAPDSDRRDTPLAVVVALMFLWVAFMYSNNTSLMLAPQRWSTLYFASPGGWHLNFAAAQLLPRYLHMVLGALAVGGLALAWWGRLRSRAVPGDQQGAFMYHQGLSVFGWVTMANVGMGLWYYLALARPVRLLFMGQDMLGTASFSVGFLAGLVAIALAMRLRKSTLDRRASGKRASDRSASDAGLKGLALLTAVTVLTLVTMIAMRDIVRGGYLADHYQPAAFPVQTQLFNIIVFAVLFLAGIGTTVWMVRKLYLARTS